MKKDTAIFFRVSAPVKKAADQAARLDDRPLAAWVHKVVVDKLRELELIK